MPEKIWKKYEKLKIIENKNTNIKTYLARIEPIVKEIKMEDKDDFFLILQRLEELRDKFKIYDIIVENETIYVVLDNDEELSAKVNKILLSEEFDITKEGVVEGHGAPITKNEIFELFKLDKTMCKIESKTKDNQKITGSGFFCKLDDKFPFKYALFTNNHVIDESNIDIGKTIKFEFLEFQKSLFSSSYNASKKEIKITDKRRVYTNKELDYTCIELFESDGIKDYLTIDPDIFKYDNSEILINNDIFILQFPNGKDISFSYGKIVSIEDNVIIHNASTEGGSSGSPIIRRSDINYIIGLHFGGKKDKEKKKYVYNLATNFVSILYNINEQIKKEISEIKCIYIADRDKNEIKLLHDYSNDIELRDEEDKKIYFELRKSNKSLFENNIELYINERKVKFQFKYKMNELKEIKVKFKFRKNIIKKASYMFGGCSSLKSIDLSLFDTSNINNMSYMFRECSSLKSIDLSSFDTSNVNNMRAMFGGCSSLKSIDLSSFNTSKVNNMSYMFYGCTSLQSIDLSSFNTSNVNNMSCMFKRCSSLLSLDLSSFDTNKVNNLSHMFGGCSSLKSINLSSFDTSNVNNTNGMFGGCSSLRKDNIKIKNKNERLK